MKTIHNPWINFRYWVLLCSVSVLGTNVGDLLVRLYAQSVGEQGYLLGLKHIGPFPLLAVMFVAVLFWERASNAVTDVFFWAQILIIRAAATNVADTLGDDLNVAFWVSTSVFSSAMVVYAILWQRGRLRPIDYPFMPDTTPKYWLGMLMAGVLGTLVGDEVFHEFGLANTALVLSVCMALLIVVGYRSFLVVTSLYWFGVVFARVAGTAAGDWLAKSTDRGGSGLDLYSATLVSATVFAALVWLWRNETSDLTDVETQVG
jgi:uncharacterized membrane-anchored protein